jgi:uncharacterized RDD family membrane protein YckC
VEQTRQEGSFEDNPYRSPIDRSPLQKPRRDFRPAVLASRRSRLAAALLDRGIPLLILVIATVVATGDYSSSAGAKPPLYRRGLTIILPGRGAVWCVGVFELAQAILITLRGQTLGKMLLGIRIARVEDDHNPGFFRGVFLRSWLIAFLALAPVIGWVLALIDLVFIFRAPKRCIHDYVSGTRVVLVNLES